MTFSERLKALPLRTSFDKQDWRVVPTSVSASKDLVAKYHYAKSASPQFIYLFGLFLNNDWTCYGVSWWITAALGSVQRYNPGGESTSLVLHRLVVHPIVPTNGASFLLGRSMRLIEQERRYEFLITYADTWRNHTGAIYKATNWHYEGLSNPQELWLHEGKLIGRHGMRSDGTQTTNADLIAMGAKSIGAHQKHVFTRRLKARQQEPYTLNMFAKAVSE